MKNFMRTATRLSAQLGVLCAFLFVSPLLAQEQKVLEPEFDANGNPIPVTIDIEYDDRNRPVGLPAVEPQYNDEEGDPAYYYVINGNPPGEPPDYEGMELKDVLYFVDPKAKTVEEREPISGWMDFATYDGWRRYHESCHVCHGPDGMGSTYAPAITESMKTMNWEYFANVVINGRGRAEGAAAGNVMPAFGEDGNVAPYVEDLYRYLKMRADGKVRRGVRMPRLPKYKEPS